MRLSKNRPCTLSSLKRFGKHNPACLHISCSEGRAPGLEHGPEPGGGPRVFAADAQPSLGCLMRSLTPPGLVLVDGAPVMMVVPSLGSSLAFLCSNHVGEFASS